MHHVKNFFLLTLDHNADLLAHRLHLVCHIPEGFGAGRGVNDHHHVKEALNDSLRNIQNIDLVLGKVGSDLRNNTNRIFSNYSNNCFLHVNSFLSMIAVLISTQTHM